MREQSWVRIPIEVWPNGPNVDLVHILWALGKNEVEGYSWLTFGSWAEGHDMARIGIGYPTETGLPRATAPPERADWAWYDGAKLLEAAKSTFQTIHCVVLRMAAPSGWAFPPPERPTAHMKEPVLQVAGSDIELRFDDDSSIIISVFAEHSLAERVATFFGLQLWC